MRSRLAELIAKEEGFGKPGTLPTRNHNPGDLRHSPHSQHEADHPEGIGRIDSDEHGWEDLERQLRLYAARGLSLRQMITQYYAPPGENNSERYLRDICNGLGLHESTLVSAALALGDDVLATREDT